ncbi:uncharacterized protein LOC127244726 [Andrographis paniculata]|uniref:uncharacterized protein LOC127244726 n=1 Tax=Andrographis paniculata TaxID=175694 RepID=UPI0021E938E6|nr:uncharacterized protein LOC127244726 [Andrographis paniculata]
MFEGLVRQLILGYLGKYIKDIQKEQLKITLWNEEVLLENVELIVEAFDYLRLPFAFKQGRVGKLSIRIPWKKLGWDPFIIMLEDVYICVSQRDDNEWCLDAVERREFASKKAQLATAELAKLSRRVCDNQTGKSFVSYITAKIIDSIQVSIRNVHILYWDSLCEKEDLLLGLKFSSLTIMRQAIGSSSSKVRGGQVNKLIEVQNLEVHCENLRKTYSSSTKDVQRYDNVGGQMLDDRKCSSILAPLDVSVSLSVNRSGNLLNDLPQYDIKVDMACVETSMDEVQLQNILSLSDYMEICRLREKYGRYRPWWSPIGKRLKGWQKAWWHYAQESVLSDVQRRLRKKSWKYFGQRLYSCRTYVKLYKAKLKCLRHDQVIEESVLHELEKIEKATDIDDILNYRSIAEHELEDFLLNTSSKYGKNGGNVDKVVEDDHPPSKPRGWLNWLSYGMLGAGGTDDFNQFSGVVSDDVIEDIYEATKFHPSTSTGDLAANDVVYIFSMKVNISEFRTTLRSMKLGQAIADLMLKQISVEGRAWEKSASITASVNFCHLLNPFKHQVILSTKEVNSEHVVVEQRQPSLIINVDLSPASSNLGSSVKVMLSPTEVFCDSEFVKNILDFLLVMEQLSFQHQRIMLSLHGIDDLNSRLISKIDYVLSIREKIIWDINLLNIVVSIPLEYSDGEECNMLIEASAVSFSSKSEIQSYSLSTGDMPRLHGKYVSDSVCVDDNQMGFKLQDLYDHFDMQIDDFQIKLKLPSESIMLLEKFSATASLASCILPNEPILQEFDVSMRVATLHLHFSPLVYEKLMGFISQFYTLIPQSETTDSFELKSNVLKASMCSWLTMDACFDEIHILLDLEDSVAEGCTLNLYFQKLCIWYDQSDSALGWASVQACQITASSKNSDWDSHVLVESVSKHNMSINLEGESTDLGDKGSLIDGCIVLQFDSQRNIQSFIQKYTIYTCDLEIHLYPFIIGKFIDFLDRISAHGTSEVCSEVLDVQDENAPGYGSNLDNYDFLSEIGSSEPTSILFDHFPFTRFENLKPLSDLHSTVDNMKLKFSENVHLRGQKMRPSKFGHVESVDRCSKLLLGNVNLCSITVHFHDSLCVVSTIIVPLAKSLLTISADSLDMVCFTEQMVLSSSWWPQTITKFLWEPLSSKCPILNLHLKQRRAGLHNFHLEMCFDIQQVSCMLPPDYISMIIGYFSLPDWSANAEEKVTDAVAAEESNTITYHFKIANCNVITPADSDWSEFLKLNIAQLSIAFSQYCKCNSIAEDIPSLCCIDTGKFSHRNDCLDLHGCDLSLSLLVLDKYNGSPLNMYQSHILIASLTADFWIRMPYDFMSDGSPYPNCIMAMVKDCQLLAEELHVVAGLKALDSVINQFSQVDEESKLFTSDVQQFLQAKKQMMECTPLVPITSNMTLTDMRFCVMSLCIRFHQLKKDSNCSELMAEAEMHFVCSLSLINDRLSSLEVSFYSLSLFSLSHSVMLSEFSCPGSGSSVLDVIFVVSVSGENLITVSFYCLDIWLHLHDWNEIIGLLSVYSTHLSAPTSGSSSESIPGIPSDHDKSASGESSAQMPYLNVRQSSGLCTLILEHVGLALHIPALVAQDTDMAFDWFHFHKKQPSDEYNSLPCYKQNCFLLVSLQIRKSKLIADGKTVKLKVSSEYLNGVVKLFYGGNATTWPLFQLCKANIEAHIYKDENDKAHMEFMVRCDSMDLSFSNQILCILQFTWFEQSEEVPSRFNFARLDLQVQLRKFSLLLTDWKISNGPLLDFLVRNSNFVSTITEDELEGSVMCDLEVNYYSIDKVLWEPFVEPCKLQLSMHRKLDERALFSGAIMTDINLESKTHLNVNINESIIEVVSMMIEMIKDAWCLVEGTGSPDFYTPHIIRSPKSRRYAPYMLQNLTTLPLIFCVCQQQLGDDDVDVSPSKGVLQPGSSTLVYINESPEELVFRYRPLQSSDKLTDKQLLEAAHRHVTFQLEGTSVPSVPISMDLVGRRFFEVEFSKSSTVSDIHNDENSSKRSRKNEADNDGVTDRGFAIPVVIDVSVQRFTKLIRLHSTVVVLNGTSTSLELRFDIPFGVSPKVLGPICPGHEFPLPLHLAEVGYIRWRPVGDSYLWSEAHRISSIISQDVRVGFMRSFICYPSHPSNDPFRCCITVNCQCLPPVGRLRSVYSQIDQSENVNGQTSSNLEIPNNRFLYRMVLSSPIVLKNYLMKTISVTLEYAGVTRPALLSEVETSFYCIDCSHDVSITFQISGYRPSTLKYPRAESFSKSAKFSGTKFSIPEIIQFDAEFSDGSLYVTMEKVMDAASGAREIVISVPFLLYNCAGFPLVLSNSVSGMKGYSCVIPSCYNLDKQSVLGERKDGLSLICSDRNLSAADSSNETKSDSLDSMQMGSRRVIPCLFSPDPRSYSGEVLVILSMYLPHRVENLIKQSWSAPFSLVPPTGSTSVLVPQPSLGSGHVLSVSAMAAPFSGRTKIITFQPRYVIANACNKNLCYKQKGTDIPFLLGAGEHSYVQWTDTTRELLLSVRFDGPGWEWSGCFLPKQLGDTQIKVRNYITTGVIMMHVEVRSADVSDGGEKIVGSTIGNSGTNLIILSEDHTGFMPYRIDNHSRERLRIYQPKCESFESVIYPYTSSPYAWDEPCYPHRLTLEVPGERILGSYAIDDSSAHSLVHLPSTSEKPERNLLISVHSEGAIKVLSIIDSSYHVLNDLKNLNIAQMKDKGKQTQKYESFVNYKEKLSIDVPFLGISLMNSHPEELLFLCAKNTKLNFVQSLDQQLFSLQVESLQIDNQLHTTLYPVILSFNLGNKGNLGNQMKLRDNNAKLMTGSMSQIAYSNLHEPVLCLAVGKWRNTDASLVSFESISLRVADFYLEIEQEIVLRLFEFCKTTSSRLRSRVFQNVDSSLNMLFPDSELVQYSSWFDERQSNSIGTTPISKDYISLFLPHIVPIGAPWQQIELDVQKEKKIYVELFDMEPIKVTLSFSSSPWILRNGVLTSGESLIHRGLMALADVEGAQIHFKQLILSHQMASWESIQEILVSHYTRQFLHEMYKVFGSAGVIGNPVGFARNLGLGIKDFFSVPIWSVFQSPTGLITGMAQGTTSLLSNTVYAITDATSQFSKAAHKGIVAFAFDNQAETMIEGQNKGIASQSKGVINEFLEGLTGVLQSPIKGAEKHGLPGLFSGIAVGITGLVARPAASLLEVTGKTAQSIRNRSRIRQMGYRCFRVRLPRSLSADLPLKPYSWEEAIGTYVLAETDESLREETLVMCKALSQSGQYVVITQRLILVVSCSTLVDLGQPHFEGVPPDLNWVMQSIIGLDSIILADNEGQVVHIVGSGSDKLSRQNFQRHKSGSEQPKGKALKNVHSPLPLLQTNIEFTNPEEADEFLRVVMCMIERGKVQGWGSTYILQQSSIK